MITLTEGNGNIRGSHGPFSNTRPRSRSPGFRSRSLHPCEGLRPRGTGNALALTPSPAAQLLAYTHPCRRFAPGVTADDARLGADAVRYSFIAVDWRHLLLAGLPAHCHVWTAPLVKGFVEALANVSGAVMSPAC